MSDKIVPIIVVVVIALQLCFFIINCLHMYGYKKIFHKKESWKIKHNPTTNFVSGIDGKGNKVFKSIINSINEYLENNSGSVIDFSLLKDAVDRHCDSMENDINTLTPVPLYCGLAGTMAGVIIGLFSLLETGSITALLSPGSENSGAVANGINDLLSGVAWAMGASICGIILTTIGSIIFKICKLKGESGKNTFFAWLQAKLLPQLPSDTSDALNRLVKNLKEFNDTFATNTAELRNALTEVNISYRLQSNIIKTVHDMDVMKMATANVNVLKELKDCTDKLEIFNQYLNDIHGYTDAIHTFTTQFEQESNRLHVLEEIKNYFNRHKAEIVKDSADIDIVLKDSLRTLKETASINTKELKSTFIQQAEEFKQILKEEKDSFEKINNEIKTQFGTQLSNIPTLEKNLTEISAIPSKLAALIDKIEHSNSTLASNVKSTMNQTAQSLTSISYKREYNPDSVAPAFPVWMKWTIIISVILIAIACISNTVYNIWHTSTYTEYTTTDQVSKIAPNSTIQIESKDSINQTK